MLVPLLLPLALATTTLHCGANVHAVTPALVAANGTQVRLRVFTEDDHILSVHDCMAAFTIVVQRANGTSSENQPDSSDGSWGRLIAIDLNGFDAQDTTAVGVLHEEDKFPTTEIFLIDLTSAQWASYALDLVLRKKLSPACIAKLAVVGTTSKYEVVVAAANAPACPATRFALTRARDKNQRDYISSLHALPKDAEVLPLDPGTAAP